MLIVHVARIRISGISGMGRISAKWREAFLSKGHEFLHIGLDEISKPVHASVWGFYARKYLEQLTLKPDIVLVHEPYGGFFLSNSFKTVIFSHGIEQRAWETQLKYRFQKRTFKSYFFPKYLRFFSNRKGLNSASLLLLSNQTDKHYLLKKHISKPVIKIFQNGFCEYDRISREHSLKMTFLFNGTWIERKGVDLIVEVFNRLIPKYPTIQLILSGTGYSTTHVIKGFKESVRNQILVIPQFYEKEEANLYKTATVFILPSYFEGQSLALTQAMAMGLCPVVSDNSGQIDFVKHRENGLLFETGNAESLYNQLVFLIDNEHLIQQYGSEARRSVEHLAWEKVASEVVSAVESIL